MSVKSRELRERRAKVCDEARLLLDRKPLSTEDRRKFDLYMAEADDLKREIDREERQGDEESRWNALDADLRQTVRPPESQIGAFEEAVDNQGERRYSRAFWNWIRNGLTPSDRGGRGVSDEDRSILLSRENRDTLTGMGVGSPMAGGNIVPTGFMYNLEAAMKWYGSMLQSSDVFDTATGNPLPWPTTDDTSNTGELLDENTAAASQDVAVAQVPFGAFKFSTKLVKVSLELLQDSAFNLEALMVDLFAQRLGRILNNKFTVGVGTTEPKGIVVAAAAGPTSVGSSVNTGGNETAAASIGSIDLIELEHSVDVAYRKGAAYMMHDNTLKAIKQLLDKYGRPLWKPGLASGDPDTINGYPYFINNDMAATIQASAKTVLFGQLKKYKVRRVRQMVVQRLVERWAEYGIVGFIGFARYDGNLLDAGTKPVKYLTQHT